MPPLARQALTFAMAVMIAAQAVASTRGRYAQQLADECNALIAAAVKRPYGWAWTAQTSDGGGGGGSSSGASRKPSVDMRPPGTPAAGIVLLWAGLLLEEPTYVEAAVHAARGVVASQASNGNVIAQPTFGATPGKREPPAPVPDRAATRAGVALLLATVGADESKDEMLRRAAIRAGTWLAKQQAHDGGWPSGAPAGADSAMPARLIRLDDRDVRDSTFALLLAAGAADDRIAARGAQRAVEKLLSLRLSAPGKWTDLWTTYYRLSGDLADDLPEFPPGADMLASRRTLETLLASALINDDEQAVRAAVRAAAASIRALRDTRGQWTRLYVLGGEQPQPAGESIFGHASTQPLWKTGTFGLESALSAVELLEQLGAQRMSETLAQSATLHERMATTICGLSDDPFSIDWPTTADEAEAYLRRNDERWRVLRGPPPDDLEARVHRLYTLLLRARLEAQWAR